MSSILKVFFGLIFLVLAIYFGITNLFGFGTSALIFLKGAILWIIVLAGLVLVSLGIYDLKN